MKSLRSLALFFAAGLLAASLSACDSGGSDDDLEPNYETQFVEDVPADPTVSTGGGPPSGTGRYTFFNLRDGEIVLSHSNAERADSSSTAWDIGLQGLNVVTNGGVSGPGEGAGYITEGAFGEVTEVDAARLETDAEGTMVLRDWYNYDFTTHVVTPLPGRTLVLRTADGEHYAKISIRSYYEGNPTDPTESDAASRYYTFEYVLSDDMSFE